MPAKGWFTWPKEDLLRMCQEAVVEFGWERWPQGQVYARTVKGRRDYPSRATLCKHYSWQTIADELGMRCDYASCTGGRGLPWTRLQIVLALKPFVASELDGTWPRAGEYEKWKGGHLHLPGRGQERAGWLVGRRDLPSPNAIRTYFADWPDLLRACGATEKEIAATCLRHWAEHEDEQLYEYTGQLPPDRLAARLRRSKGALAHRRQRLGLKVVSSTGDFSIADLCRELGLSEPRVQSWVRRGRLPSRKCGKFRFIDPAALVLVEEELERLEATIPPEVRAAMESREAARYRKQYAGLSPEQEQEAISFAADLGLQIMVRKGMF